MSRAEIPDVDVDYLEDRVEMCLADCTKRAEIHLSPSEQRGRFLAAQARLAETDVHPALQERAPIDRWLCIYSIVLAALSLLLAGMVLGHLVLLPDATVWPLGVAALITDGAAAYLGWLGLRKSL